MFAHIAWSPDSARVGVFIVNGYGEDIRSAYDTRTREKMPFTAVEKLVRDSIQYSYSLTESDLLAYSGDPLVWAEKDETAHTRFRRTRQR